MENDKTSIKGIFIMIDLQKTLGILRDIYDNDTNREDELLSALDDISAYISRDIILDILTNAYLIERFLCILDSDSYRNEYNLLMKNIEQSLTLNTPFKVCIMHKIRMNTLKKITHNEVNNMILENEGTKDV